MPEEEIGLRVALRDRLEAARGLQSLRSDVRDAGREARTSSRGFDALGRSVGSVARLTAAGVLAGGAGALALGRSALDQSSDLNESINAVNVSYGKQADAILKLGRNAATAVGLSNVEFNGLAVRFSAFARTISGGGADTVKTLDDLTGRAADFASVMNLEVAEAAELFQSGLAGETEPLRRYGLDLSAAAVEAHAYATGIAATGKELTETQKIQSRYSLLMKQTNQTAGDFANTSDQLANQQRILGARFDNAQAKLGRGLLPVATDFVRFLNREGIPAFNRASDWFLDEGIPALSDFADRARPVANEVLPAVSTALGTVRDIASEAAPYVTDLVGAFNDMPDWAKTAIVGGGLGAFAVKKTGLAGALLGSRGGTGQGGSGLLGAFSKAKPMPVFVVNNGIGGTGGASGAAGGKGSKAAGGSRWGSAAKGIGGLLAATPLPAIGALGADQLSRDEVYGPALELPPAAKREFLAQYDYLSREARDRLQSVADAFSALPMDLRAHVGLYGAPQSANEARALSRTFDLTAAERRTFFRTAGIPLATREAGNLSADLDRATRPRTAAINVDTSAAMAKISSLASSIVSLPLVNLGFSGGAVAGGRAERRATGGPVVAGRAYIVGDGGVPELFISDRDGWIEPRVPDTIGDGGIDLGAGRGARDEGRVVHEHHHHLHVNGKEMAVEVVRHIDNEVARR